MKQTGIEVRDGRVFTIKTSFVSFESRVSLELQVQPGAAEIEIEIDI
jgi:hypothetical protein